MIQQMLAIWYPVPLPFLNPAWTSARSQFTYCWSLSWRILSITLPACEMSAIVCSLNVLCHFLSLGLEWKLTFSSPESCGHCWVFQICWHIECSTFATSSLRILNSSNEVPSPPIALFVVMIPKAHLTSHSRMSASRSVITPLRLSGLWRSFLYSSSVYSCYLFLISSAPLRSLPFLSYVVPIFAWKFSLFSLIFLKKISSLSHSIVFLYFFALFT